MNNLFFIYIVSLSLPYIVLFKREKIGNYFNLIDKPDNLRKLHKIDVPLIGGIYLYFSFLIYFILFNLFNDGFQIRFALSFFLIVTSYFIIGLMDDIIKIKSISRIFLIIFATLIACSFTKEFQIEKIYISFFKPETSINLSIYFTIFCILVLNIAINLSDGTNGVTSSINTVWLIFFCYLFFEIDKNFYYIILLVIVTSVIFTIFNLKSKCFLGSSGCNVLSSISAFSAIYLNHETKIYSDTIFIFFLIPGLDMIRVIFTRLLNKKNPFSPDRDHLHHLLEIIINKNLIFLLYSFIIILFCLSTLLFQEFNLYIILFGIISYSILILYLKSISK